MKTYNLKTSSIAALLALLAATSAVAQSGRIAFSVPVSVQVSPHPARYATYSQIFTMNPDGSGVVQLTSGAANSDTPVWSPSQQYIAFFLQGNLMVMNANGTGAFRVGIPAEDGTVDWSPDGSMLVYTSAAKSADGTYHDDVYVVPINPAAQTIGTPAFFATGPSYDSNWSPDGTKVAFDRYLSDFSNSHVIVHDVATGAEYDFTATLNAFAIPGCTNIDAYAPSWSPDSTMLAFEGDPTVTNINITTTTTKQHGQIITTTTTNIVATTYTTVCIAKADGSGLAEITPLSLFAEFPVWSPDETTLAFMGSSGVYKTVIGSGVLTLLSKGNYPDWNP